MKSWLSARTYGLLTGLTRIVTRALSRVEVVHPEHVPASGPIVLYGNHLHLLDPPLVASVSGRSVRTMAKRELFETPLIGWIFWLYGAFPVRRYSADIGALRAGRNLLRNGDAVLVFPEGTRSKNGSGLQPALPGAAMMALLADAPVLPVAITGTEGIRWPDYVMRRLRGRPLHLRIEFGEPFALGRRSEPRHAADATDQMMRALARLLPKEYRGAYADPDGSSSSPEITDDVREHASLP